MKFLSNEPALLLDEMDEKTLVLSDLHLGIEYEIYKKGISIPPRVDRQRKRILKLSEETDAERLVLLGDVKHNVPRVSIGEKEKLPSFFESLDRGMELHVAKGNHDGNIERVIGDAKVEIHPTSGFRIGDFYFNHGHAWPGKEVLGVETLVRGHSHPALEFKDKLGFSSILPCWLRCDLDVEKLEDKIGKGDDKCLREAVIVPAFNRMISGMPVNREKDESLLGPLLENDVIKIDESKAYLLDGTFLGSPAEI